ncbi:tripartite motif-containing protein [Anaeramoeba flamelloides]|uniref:Tripartite motif-containing protein n=1 Tax=Anaeramoeba flamelloides TaxID=1746091 RepID=A0ABQ8XGJ5_9EUKA|nr:tripartite motif-containing protein [Anaeramoeba flamelloides]
MENSKHKKTRSKDKSEKGKQRLKKEQQNNEVRQLQVPVELPGPQCEVRKSKSSCALSFDTILKYSRVGNIDINTLVDKVERKINHNICDKHKEKLSLYCQNENRLICSECYEICRKNNHSILGLNEYSNEISEKIKLILIKIQKEEMCNNEVIQSSLENKTNLKKEIQELSNLIENQSDLMIQKIQKSKINYLNLLKKVEIISNTAFDKIMKEKESKQKMIKQKKKQINALQKMKKEKKTIKLIRESNEIIQKDIEEREKEIIRESQRKKEEKEGGEQFDLKMNRKKLIKLKNGKKTAWNSSSLYGGRICGKKIYSRGKHQIKIKIDQFPNPNSKNESNLIRLGVIKTEKRGNLIKNGEYEGAYFFRTFWNCKKLESRKFKKENGKWKETIYPEEINFKKNDIFEISLDMDQGTIAFKLNEKDLGGWDILAGKVNFFAILEYLEGKEKNQITII